MSTKRSVKEVTEFNVLIKLMKEKRFVIVDFFATWCGPCKRISPAFEAIAAKLGPSRDDVTFLKIDVDKVPEAEVRAMPTFRIFKDGRMFDEIVGAPSPEQLEAWIVKHLRN